MLESLAWVEISKEFMVARAWKGRLCKRRRSRIHLNQLMCKLKWLFLLLGINLHSMTAEKFDANKEHRDLNILVGSFKDSIPFSMGGAIHTVTKILDNDLISITSSQIA